MALPRGMDPVPALAGWALLNRALGPQEPVAFISIKNAFKLSSETQDRAAAGEETIRFPSSMLHLFRAAGMRNLLNLLFPTLSMKLTLIRHAQSMGNSTGTLLTLMGSIWQKQEHVRISA